MSDDFLNGLAQSGVLGLVLAWFMLRMEGIMKENTKAINELRESISKLVTVIH